MPKQVTLTIDGISLTVPEGMLVVDAAKKIGIDIPVFCYHPKMEPVGMCRMCLVEIGRPMVDRATGQVVREADGSPKITIGPKLETACTTPVSEGMVVLGMTDKVKAGRKEILEFLLTSHPLDCPICDKGGECPLQNLTMRFGPGTSRFLFDEKKRLAKRYPLGDLIYLDRERCIQCARCVRYAHDVVDDPVINFYQRGRALEIQTTSEPGFDSYFSGNTTDICPVGALTTADFRFEARPWEMRPVASICAHCPVGCNITINTRREARAGGDTVIKRIMPRQNEQVNEIWICDKGRFAHHFTAAADRLNQPLIRKDDQLIPAGWDEALALVAEKLRAAGSNLVALAGGRLPNEDLYNLHRLAAAQGGKAILAEHMGGGELLAAAGLAPGSNLSDLGPRSAILVAGCDLLEEAPVWFHRVKQAVDRGATLVVLNPRETKLDRYAAHAIRYAYGDEAAVMTAFVPGSNPTNPTMQAAAAALAAAENVVAFYGSEGMGLAGTTGLAYSCAALLAATGHAGRANNGLVAVWPHANTQGAYEIGFRPDECLAETLRAAGVVYIAAADPAGDDPALAAALESAGFVVVQELFLTRTAALADVVLPAASWTEREGTFTSGERRVQRFYQAIPARPGPLPDYAITARVATLLGHPLEDRSLALIFNQIAAEIPAFAGLTYPLLSQVEEQWPIVGRGDLYYGGTTYDNRQGLGVTLQFSTQSAPQTAPPDATRPVTADDILLVVPVTRLYDRGVTVTPSALLREHLAAAQINVHPDTAARLGLAEGVDIPLTINGVTAPVGVRFNRGVPAGVALLPRSTGLPIWEPVTIKVQPATVHP